MKPTVILPIITALLGFGAGWFLKPGSEPAAIVRKTPPPRPTVAPPVDPRGASDDLTPRRAPTVKPQAQADDSLNEQVKSRDEAKLARLTEALNLTDEQKVAISKAMNAAEGILNPEATLDPAKMLETALSAAATIEKAIAATLTPEQAAAFAALRKRSEENTIESTSQSRLNDLAKLSDLSPEQREKLAGIIRDDVRAGYQARPTGLDLVLDTSVMPVGNTFIANSSVDFLLFTKGNSADPSTQEAFRSYQRQNLDTQFERYKPVLTPAQQERLRIDIEERRQAIDRVAELPR